MTRISLAMIAKNEADCIAACLTSARSFVDEIVVVDTGSMDGTPELVRQASGQVFHFPWCDDFSAARNESLSHCTGDWVLVLDADEELAEDAGAILASLAGQPDVHAVRMILRNYLATGTMVTLDSAPTRVATSHPRAAQFTHQTDFHGLRFFRRYPWVRYEGRIHELVDDAFEAHGLAITQSDAVIHHFGKTLRVREDVKRHYYLDLARKDAEAHPGRKQAHFNLLQQAMNAWDWPTTLAAAEAYVRLSPKGPALVLLGGAVALQSMGRHQEAIAWFQRLLDSQPGHGIALTRLAVSQASLGHVPEARKTFQHALAKVPDYTLAYINFAEMELAQGSHAAARDILERGLVRHPHEAALWELLVKTGIVSKRLDMAARDAGRALQAVPKGGGGLWHRLVAISLKEMGHDRQALAVLALGLEAHPGDPELLALKGRMA